MARFTEVTYRTVEPSYFDQRQIRRHAGFWSLFAFGIGTAIAGEFSGWSRGLLEGGFGGLLVATMMVTVMYIAFCLSQAELAAMMPFAGGGYAYVRAGLGPAWGAFAAYMQVAGYVLLAAGVCLDIADHLEPVLHGVLSTRIPAPVTWLLLYALFVAINVRGVRLTFVIVIATTLAACAVLVGDLAFLHGGFDVALALDVQGERQIGSAWLPNGLVGIAWAIPFAIWFYLGIEALPLAAEESQRPRTQLPRALIGGMVVLAVLAFAVLVLNSAVAPGGAKVGESSTPLLRALLERPSSAYTPRWREVLSLTGSIASFHAIIYVYGRAIFAASRAGHLPTWLSVTHARRATPCRALVVGAAVGFALLSSFSLVQTGKLSGDSLVYMSAFAALVGYILQMVAYLVLARDHPHLSRPYRSPAGATGAMTALITAATALVLMLVDARFWSGLYGTAIALALGMAYHFLHARQHLILSPEEAYAVAAEQAHGRRAADAVDPPATDRLRPGVAP